MHGVGHVPGSCGGGDLTRGGNTVGVSKSCKTSHGDPRRSEELVDSQIVTDPVDPAKLVSRMAGVAGDVMTRQTSRETVSAAEAVFS